MSVLDHEFHVKFPIRGTIYFNEHFKGKTAPFFIDCLSDRYIVFYSHLGLPKEYQDKLVEYIFDFTFLDSHFKLKGHLLRSDDLGGIYMYEGKFIDHNYDRSRLFSLLNKYSIFLYRQSKEDKKTSLFISKRV